ncbi:hypothetical protein C8R43DRAFT_946198 [Mycena crocata]|nr:hypothetical protein C8R43DRAFT_946198 [Mycena crocata]
MYESKKTELRGQRGEAEKAYYQQLRMGPGGVEPPPSTCTSAGPWILQVVIGAPADPFLALFEALHERTWLLPGGKNNLRLVDIFDILPRSSSNSYLYIKRASTRDPLWVLRDSNPRRALALHCTLFHLQAALVTPADPSPLWSEGRYEIDFAVGLERNRRLGHHDFRIAMLVRAGRSIQGEEKISELTNENKNAVQRAVWVPGDSNPHRALAFLTRHSVTRGARQSMDPFLPVFEGRYEGG